MIPVCLTHLEKYWVRAQLASILSCCVSVWLLHKWVFNQFYRETRPNIPEFLQHNHLRHCGNLVSRVRGVHMGRERIFHLVSVVIKPH